MGVERARRAHQLEPPDVTKELLFREDARRLLRKCPQQGELLCRELDRLAPERHLPGHRVDAKLTDLHRTPLAPLVRTPQHRPDARHQLRVMKWLAHALFVSPDPMRNRSAGDGLNRA